MLIRGIDNYCGGRLLTGLTRRPTVLYKALASSHHSDLAECKGVVENQLAYYERVRQDGGFTHYKGLNWKDSRYICWDDDLNISLLKYLIDITYTKDNVGVFTAITSEHQEIERELDGVKIIGSEVFLEKVGFKRVFTGRKINFASKCTLWIADYYKDMKPVLREAPDKLWEKDTCQPSNVQPSPVAAQAPSSTTLVQPTESTGVRPSTNSPTSS